MGCYWLESPDQRGCFFGKLNDAAAKAGTASYSASHCRKEVYYKDRSRKVQLNVSAVDVYEGDLIANLSSIPSLQAYVK